MLGSQKDEKDEGVQARKTKVKSGGEKSRETMASQSSQSIEGENYHICLRDGVQGIGKVIFGIANVHVTGGLW